MGKINQYINNKIIRLVFVSCVSAVVSGCIQSNAATNSDSIEIATKPTTQITENTLKVVNAAFYQKFVLGDWRYKGARNLGGTINAYIQIPGPLDMTKEVQKAYLKQLICPSSDHVSMWNEVNNIPLSIHIYTKKQKNSLYVNCQNPFQANLAKL